MLPFTPDDLDIVTVSALEYTAGVTAHSVLDASAASWVVSTLSVTGPWECHVEIAIDADLAAALTRQMWDQDVVADDEVCDAVGEIANVIAGGIKGMTPTPGCGLTLPVTLHGNVSATPETAHLRRYFHVMSKAVCVTAVFP
jgi:chemotaxis protein CheX